MKTKLLFNDSAREKIWEGIEKINKAVSITLGPRGRNVAIARSTAQNIIYQRVIIHDGVNVAKAIDLEDEFENMGAQIITEAAKKTVNAVGDGTTLTIILTHAIISEARKLIAAGINSMSLRKDLENAEKIVISAIKKISSSIKNLDQKIQIATISAEDSVLGKLIAQTLHSVGIDGIVTVEESKSPETYVEHQQGMLIDRGYASVYMVTNPQKLETVLEDSYVLVTDYEINNIQELIRFLSEDFIPASRILTIFALDFGGDALPSFVKNKLENRLLTLCVKAPMAGDKQKAILEDIAILTGSTFISKDTGKTLKSVKMTDLGKANRIIANKNTTLIIGGSGNKEDINKRIQSIKLLIKDVEGWEKKKLEERLAKLTNGIAIIKVGGATEIEMLERYERVEDAVGAVKAAIKGGIVMGGEMTYLRILDCLKNETNGEIILKKALYAPFKKLLENADINWGMAWQQLKNKDKNYGMDVIDGKIKDMFIAGIIDPTLVITEALKNAISIAIQLISTDVIIVPVEKK